MKRRIWMTLLLMLTALFSISALVACKTSSQKEEGPETGVYYCDIGNNVEYLITLNSGDKFAFIVAEANKSGTYELDGEDLILTFNNEEDGEIRATMIGEMIVLKYEGSELRFLKKITYTVSFETNGGSAVKSVPVTNGKSIAKPTDPTKQDSVLVGWYLDEDFNVPFIFGATVVTSDITLYARWGKQTGGFSEFTINFDLNYDGARDLEPQETIGGSLYSIPAPTRQGYTFSGWWVSMYNDPAKLSYAVTERTVFEENVTVYARWEAASATKLAMPQVWIESDGIYWNLVNGATSYDVVVEGPTGFATLTQSVPTSPYKLEFGGLDASEYVIKVTAKSGNTADTSDTTVCYYRNKSLARVSRFEVVLSSTLLFNPVEGAQYYTITVDCGDKNHKHTNFNNGSSTYYNFSNCLMQEEGIKFTVMAHAEGYLSSTSETFVFKKTLDTVKNVGVDDATQTLYWEAVPEATNYVLDIYCTNANHSHVSVDNGNKTSFDLKECGRGMISVSITPKTKGYNSPEATNFSYNKTTIATPGNFKIVGTTLSWDAVEGANSYRITVGNQTKTVSGTSFDLAEMNWVSTVDYTLTVSASDASSRSPESNGLDMRYMELFATMSYNRNVLTWRHVLGAERYIVTLNGEEIAVEAGKNFAEIEWKQAGVNTLSVKFVDKDNFVSEAATLEVMVYTITFDSRGGSAVKEVYAAYGDALNLPTSERAGYDFDGWYNAPGGANSNAGRYLDEYYMEAGDSVLYASWASKSYQITYVYDDGRDRDETEHTVVYYKQDYSFKIPSSILGTNGFLGWFAEEGGRGKRYTNERGEGVEPWDVMGDTKVYAHWAQVLEYTRIPSGTKAGQYTASVRSGPDIGLLSIVTIPMEIDGYPVQVINSGSFSNVKTLKTIEIPDTVTLIQSSAFDGCDNLENITIYETGTLLPEEITYKDFDGVVCRSVGDDLWSLFLFPQAKKGRYRIPAGISQIGSDVFKGTQVTEVIVSADVTFVAEEAFSNCPNLALVTFEDALDSLKRQLTISDGAFKKCPSLTKVAFPRQLYQLGEDPNGRNGVFQDCEKLTELTVSTGNIHSFASVENMITKDRVIVYVIPKSISGAYTIPTKNIIGVGPYAFASMGITELTVPTGIRTIDSLAFTNNLELTKIVFESSTVDGLTLTIGDRAFMNCAALSDVVFEKNSIVSSIGVRAFEGCFGLEEITLPGNLTEIKDYAFISCSSLATVNFEAATTSYASLKLGRAIFSNCPLLRVINLPAHVSEISYGAFDGANALSGVYVAEKGTGASGKYVDIDGVLYVEAGGVVTELIYYPKVASRGGNINNLPSTLTTIGDSVFKNFATLTSITIPKSVTYIGAEAFYGCYSLTSITFEDGGLPLTFGVFEDPDGVTGAFTFAGCTNLTEITIPNRVSEIPAYFMYRANTQVRMSSITIPNSVTVIGDYAFRNVTLSNVQFSTSLRSIGVGAFMDTQLAEVDFSGVNYLESIGDSAFEGTRVSLVTLNASGRLQTIGARAFYGLKIPTLTLPEGLKSIGKSAFENTSLITLIFPASLETVADNAFAGCTMLQSYNLQGDVAFGEDVFTGCSSLYRVTISNGVSKLPANILKGTAIKELELPATITEIGDYAFAGAEEGSSLEKITIAANARLEKIGKYAFWNCTSLKEIKLPGSVKTIDAFAFSGCTGLTSFTIPESVTYVGEHAFSGCTALASVTFDGKSNSGGLTLGTYVFENCSVLTTVFFSPNLKTLDGTIFRGCDMLRTVRFNGNDDLFSDGLLISLDGTELILALPGADAEVVTVPNTVEYVANEAFARAKFKKIIFAEGGKTDLYIGSKANTEETECRVFAENIFLEEVQFPARLRQIGVSAFEGCTALKKVNIPAGVEYIGQAAFKDATALEEVTFEPGGTMQGIGKYAFENAGSKGPGIKGIDLPEGMKEIESDIFSNANFLSFSIPASVLVIDAEAFRGCAALEKVTIADESKLRDIETNAFRDCAKLKTFEFLGTANTLHCVYSYAFYGCSSLEAFAVPEASRLQIIEKYAFAGSGIKSFNITAKVMSIEPYAFADCRRLQTVTSAEGGKDYLALGDISKGTATGNAAYIFADCSALEEVRFPERVSEMGTYMFYGCTNLKKVNFPVRLTEIPNYTFAGCRSLETIEGIEHITTIGSSIFSQGGPKSFTIPRTVTNLASNAFQYASTLGEITFESGCAWTEIASSAFSGCSSLTTVNFGDNEFTAIGEYAFQSCNSLRELTIPNSVQSIGASAFSSCSSLETLHFMPGSSLGIINNYAFQYAGTGTVDGLQLDMRNTRINVIRQGAFQNSGLSSILFPNITFTEIGASAFANCSRLVEFTVPAANSYGTNMLQNSTRLQIVYFSTQLTNYPTGMLAGCSSLREIHFTDVIANNGVEEGVNFKIVNNVLYNRNMNTLYVYPGGLTGDSFSIPDSVVTISASAFEGVSGLRKLTIPAATQNIGNYAFRNTYLEEVVFNNNPIQIGDSIFSGSSRLRKVTMNEFTQIWNSMFSGCAGLEEVVFSNKLTKIGASAFANSGIKKLEIPASVTSIESSAFNGSRLQSITFASGGSSLSISERVFEGTSLETITLPDRATLNGTYIFYNCSKLKSITLPSTLSAIADYTFSGCSSLKTVTLRGTVTSVGMRAFERCYALETVSFREGLRTMADGAFMNSGIQYMILPASLTSLGNYVFYNCDNLANLVFEDNGSGSALVVGDRLLYGCLRLTRLTLPDRGVDIKDDGMVEEQKGLFGGSSCPSLEEVDIPYTMTTISSGMFANCTALKKINFPSNSRITSIGSRAFENTKSLKSIEFPSMLTSISMYAFRGSGLESVSIPNIFRTTQSLGDYAFADCTSLTTIRFEESYSVLNRIPEGLFSGCTSLTEVTLPTSIQFVMTKAFAGCTSLKTIAGDGVRSIYVNAFDGCAKLETVNFPSATNLYQWTTAENSGFRGCTSLKSVTLTQTGSVTIGNYAFYGLTSLESVNAASIASVGNYAFYNCTGLKDFNFTSVASIGQYAFYHCDGLVSITIEPEQLLPTIGDYAFAECSKLSTLSVGSKVLAIGAYSFENCSSLTGVTLSTGLTSIGQYAFSGCTSLEMLKIPTSVTSIGDGAFKGIARLEVEGGGGYQFEDGVLYDATKTVIIAYLSENTTFAIPTTVQRIAGGAFTGSGIQRLTIPDSVQVIGDYAFDGCSELTTVTFTGTPSLNSLGRYMFRGCDKLTSFTIPESVTDLGSYVFAESSITSFTIPSSITKLSEYAFAGSAVRSITIPSSVMIVEKGVFQDCAQLTSVVMQAEVYTVGDYLFAGCKSLTFGQLVLPVTLEAYSQHMFEGCESFTTVSVPENITAIGSYAFNGCSNLESITLPATLRYLGDPTSRGDEGTSRYIFAGTNLRSLSLPTSVAAWGITTSEHLFDGIRSESFKLELPATITTLGSHMFANATSENFTLTIEGAVTTYGDYMFEGAKIKTFVVPTAVTSLGKESFRGSALEEFEILSVTGETNSGLLSGTQYLFAGLTSDHFTLKLPAYITPNQLSDYLFAELNTKSFEITVPSHFGYMPNYMFAGSSVLEEIKINGNLTMTTSVRVCENVEDYLEESNKTHAGHLFANCSALKKVTLPDTVEYLGASTFNGCTSLENFTIGSKVKFIGYSCFSDCTALKELVIPASVQFVERAAFRGMTGNQRIVIRANTVNQWENNNVNGTWQFGAESVQFVYEN